MEKDFHKEFKKCPVCKLREELAKILGKPDLKLGDGSDRFLEQLGKEMKDRGLAREEWNIHLQAKQGPVLDPTKEAAIPIGSEIPGYDFKTDICMDCGCIYAIELRRLDIKKSPAPPQLIPPNRATRRRLGGDKSSPFSLS